ncbi:hypothetical protein K2X14_03950 [Acetobacter sp. TBRC 12305]|uniref:histidine kinase n=1 Tax=Acetobacter garciniae TaxID=2817435 RepID=A0A939KPS3_9PROT|nr:ATP-binding protein [Acetobacter garciniae]MBO1324312.1 hypothetical protein [Acetobacter garciniae]MBX0344001.1 hypothetical protein [Acetobacter garciniae]
MRSRWVFLSRIVGMLCLCSVVLLACLLYPPSTRSSPELWQQSLDRAEFLKQVIPGDLDTTVPDHIAAEDPTGPWQTIELPYTDRFYPPAFPDQGNRRSRTTTWYRFTIAPPMPANGDRARTGFYLPAWKTQGHLALYQNGVLVWCSQGGAAGQGIGYPVLVQLPFSGASVLTLRMDMPPGGQGAMTAARIGSYDALAWRYRIRRVMQYWLPAALAVLLLSGSVMLSVLAMGRTVEHLCHYQVAAVVLYATYCLFFLGGEHFTYAPLSWISWGAITSLCWLIVVVWLLCSDMAEITFPWLKRLLVGGVALGSVVTLPLFCPDNWRGIFSVCLYACCWIVPLPMLPSLATGLWRRGAHAGLLLITCNLLLLPGVIHDVALAYDRIGINHNYLMPYLIPLVLFNGLYLLGRQYVDSLHAAEQATEQLQSRFELQESALRESYERLRQVEQRDLLSAERQRLMRDMHDGLGSTLTGAIHMTNGDTPHAVLRQTLQDCLYDLKITVDSLESVDADLLVLLANLRYRLASRFQAHGMTLEWSVKAVPPLVWLTPSAALHILRILQEVIANIIKHAGADRIRVATGVDGLAIVIFVEDNGKGFIANKQATGGRGLHNIRWRAQAINSRAHWSALAKGTRFTLWMPIQQPDGSVTTLSPGMSLSAMKNL